MNIEKLLKDIIQIKSISGQEKSLAHFIINYAKKYQMSYEKQDNNLIIKFITGSKKCLIFNGHLDTVKEGNIKSWKYPPYGSKAGVIQEGKMYGLGASDMKASLTIFLVLSQMLVKQKPAIDVFFSFVVKEEVDGSGSYSFVEYFKQHYFDKYKEVAVIVGEPTGNEVIEIGHRGNVFIELTTIGDSGHAAQPLKIKQHAIYKMVNIIKKMKKISQEAAILFQDKLLGQPTFCLTGIKSQITSLNKVPRSCASTWDIRTTPKLHYQLKQFLQKKLGNKVEIGYLAKPALFSFISSQEKIVSLFKKIVPKLKITVSPAANDSCFFTQAGFPTVAFGPGQKQVCHQENEYVVLKNIPVAIRVYQKLIQNF